MGQWYFVCECGKRFKIDKDLHIVPIAEEVRG